MSRFKSLSYAVFMAFLCIIPCVASAQDDAVSRLIDIPNVENDVDGLAFTTAIREAIGESGHLVFSEEEMIESANQIGVGPGYWNEPALIKKVNRSVRHDALIRFVYQQSKKSSSIVFYIYNAYTGELMQDFEIKLAKKGKLSKTEKTKIKNAVESILSTIDASLYPADIVIKINSTPEGAEVMRNGLSIGTTPLEYTLPPSENEELEQWVLVYPDREPVMQNISIARSATYDVNIPNVVVVPEEDTKFGKVKGGFGRPLLLAGFNVSPTIRRLKSQDNRGASVFSYKTKVFATPSFDIEFFPAPLITSIDYLQGLALKVNVGFGFLDSSLQVKDSNTQMCEVVSTNGSMATIRCKTTYVRANVDVMYRLLLQEKEGKLDPNGMAVDFFLGYNMNSFKLDNNSLYRGHVYHGMNIGARYSTPLGMDAFRFDVNLAFDINTRHGGVSMIEKWGTHIGSSWGLDTGFSLSYNIWNGIYARVGYEFSYDTIQYKGNGCLDVECSSPKNANVKDFYHEIMFGFGYALF